MESELKYIDMVEQPISMNPLKFIVWLFIVAEVLFFAGLTSAYIVRQAEGNWLEFELPDILWMNSGIAILSSVSLIWSNHCAKKDFFLGLNLGIALTLLLGIAFLVGQWYSLVSLVDQEVFFVGNPAGSFVYVLIIMHAFHLISGLIFMIILLILSLRLKVHSKAQDTLDMATTYWHFLGGLWLYLFLFLLLNH